MTVSVGELFPLSTFAATKRKEEEKSIFTSSVSSNSPGNSVALFTVQGEGIHLFDVSTRFYCSVVNHLTSSQAETIHPVFSISLGPSTSYACSAAARIIGDVASIFVAIKSSPNVSPDLAGRVIWSWRYRLSEGMEIGNRTETKVRFLKSYQRNHLPFLAIAP
jgi:hypothetical protein